MSGSVTWKVSPCDDQHSQAGPPGSRQGVRCSRPSLTQGTLGRRARLTQAGTEQREATQLCARWHAAKAGPEPTRADGAGRVRVKTPVAATHWGEAERPLRLAGRRHVQLKTVTGREREAKRPTHPAGQPAATNAVVTASPGHCGTEPGSSGPSAPRRAAADGRAAGGRGEAQKGSWHLAGLDGARSSGRRASQPEADAISPT